MGESQSKQRSQEEQKRIQQLAIGKRNLEIREEQLQRQLRLEQLKRKEEEEKHKLQLEQARHQRQLEEEKHQTQLRIERQWHIQKLVEEKNKSEELKKQTEEFERKLQEKQQQEDQSLYQQQEIKYFHQFVTEKFNIKPVKRQTHEIQRNVEARPHHEQDLSKHGLHKENNLQQLVMNGYLAKPKEEVTLEQPEKGKPLNRFQQNGGRHLQQKEDRNIQHGLHKENNFQQPVTNENHSKPKKEVSVQQENQQEEKFLNSFQQKLERHFFEPEEDRNSQHDLPKESSIQQSSTMNRNLSKPKKNLNLQHPSVHQEEVKPLNLSQQKGERLLQQKEDTYRQNLHLEEKMHERETLVDRGQKNNIGTKRKNYKFKREADKTQSKREELKQDKLDDLIREHQFYLAPVTNRHMWHAVLNESLASKWMPMPKDKSFIKVEILEDSDEFISINMLFRSTQKKFKIVQLDRIQNPYLLGCYLLKGLELHNTFGSVTATLLFRGTKQRHVHNICQDNFNWRLQEGENGRNRFGKGVSFTSSAYNAAFYCDKDSNRKVMFLAQVMVSKEIPHDPDMIVPPPLLGRWPGINNQNNVLRYDTTRANGGKIWVKYSDNDFYPQYLIHYTEESQDKGI